MSGPRRAVVILNPSKPRWRAARDEILTTAEKLGWPAPHVELTSVHEPGGPQARAAVEAGADLVVVGGGDGTVREVVCELDHTGVGLGVVPLGTANLFARNLTLTRTPLATSVRTALTGPTITVDVGVAVLDTTAARLPEHLFLVFAGIGHDGATVAQTRPALKRHAGWLAYLESGARHLLRPPVPMSYQVDGSPVRAVDAWSVLAGSCGRIPGGVEVFPGAQIDDGLLDVLVVTVTNPLQWFGLAAKGTLKFGGDVPGAGYYRGRSLVVTPLTPQPVHLDGDLFLDVTRFALRIDEKAVTVAVPSTSLPGRRPR